MGIGSLGVIAAAIGVTLALVLAPGTSSTQSPPAHTVTVSRQASPYPSTTVGPSTVPLASVFVCTDPGQCTGFTGNTFMQTEPSDIDVSGGISGLNVWVGWGTERATSTGIINLTAGCTVTLTGLVPYTNDSGRAVYAYSTITVYNQADNQTLPFTSGNVP